MVQFIKEEIKNNIIASAKKEFLTHGFQKASIRTIAAGAETAKSNVYNYFSDKDALFCAVVGDSVSAIRSGLEKAEQENMGKSAEGYTPDSQKRYMSVVIEFVAAHSEDMRLLLFMAEGSSLSSFRDEVRETFADILEGWLKSAMGSSPSRFFISCVAGFYIETIERILLEKPAPQKAGDYMREFLAFVYGGWRGVIQAL